MDVKSSIYNLSHTIDDNNYLINTATGCGVNLGNDSFKYLLKVLDHIDKTGGVFKEGLEIADQLYEAGFIVDRKLDEFNSLKLEFKTHLLTKKLKLTIIPVSSCNMRCSYCFEGEKSEVRLSTQDLDLIVNFINDNIKDAKLLEVAWFGGEPLLAMNFIVKASREFKKIASENNIDYISSMVSNCYELDEETQKILADSDIKSIQVTFDGAREEHNNQRSVFDQAANVQKGSYVRIIENIKTAVEKFKINIRVNVSPKNIESIPDLLKELHRIGLNRKVNSICFAPLTNYEQSTSGDMLYYSKREFSEVEYGLLKTAIKYNFEIGNPLKKTAGCIANREHSFVIDSDGSLKKCEHDTGDLNTEFSHIKSFNEVKTENINKWNRFGSNLQNRCKSCKLFPICSGGCTMDVINQINPDDICCSLKYNWKEILPLFYEKQNLPEKRSHANKLSYAI